MNTEAAVIPGHVPAGLVYDIDFATMPGVMQDPHAALARLLDLPPVFFAPRVRFGGPAWVLARYELIAEAYQDAGLFSSRHNADFSSLLGEDWRLIPLEIEIGPGTSATVSGASVASGAVTANGSTAGGSAR